MYLTYLYSHSSAIHTTEERQEQSSRYFSITQGVYSFLSPVPGEVFVGGDLTGGAQAHQPGYHQITLSGFQNEFLRNFAIAEPCIAWLHFINPERVMRE